MCRSLLLVKKSVVIGENNCFDLFAGDRGIKSGSACAAGAGC